MTARPRDTAAALIRAGAAVPAAGGLRYELIASAWAELAGRLHADHLPLATLWSDGTAVHALFLEQPDRPLLASVAVESRRYLALSPARPAMAVCERIVRDLWGLEAMGARDFRPWLDHGHWGMTAPLFARPGPAAWPPEPPGFRFDAADEAAGAFQLGIGPVQGLVEGPAQLRLTVDGERIRRVEPLLGHGHRGVVGLSRGRDPQAAARLVARIDAQAAVAHQCAFARAVETASALVVPAEVEALRDAMTAAERLAVHLHHLGRVARRAGLDRAAGLAATLREAVLVACVAAFGHRLMLDAVVPGGSGGSPDPAGLRGLPATLDQVEVGLPALRRALLDDPAAARRLGGSSSDNVWIRCRERLDRCRGAIDFARRRLAGAAEAVPLRPAGPVVVTAEGIGMAGSVHGTVWHWVRLEAGLVSALHVHDPVWSSWSMLEELAQGLPVEELPLLCASLGLSSAGADQ